MIEALILYGSQARGDAGPRADTDLLGISQNNQVEKHSFGSTSLHIYNFKDLSERSKSGDLFMIHLCLEGQALFDPKDHFELLKYQLDIKRNYFSEKKRAVAIGQLVVNEFRKSKSKPFPARRILWAIRTIIIADSVENNKFSFSTEAISNYSNMVGLFEILRDKRITPMNDFHVEIFFEVVKKFTVFDNSIDVLNSMREDKFLLSVENELFYE
ncbi:hypothetical protein MNR02_16455 [Shinella sp. H4-D48]|uniref:hypothetical protein n=1 Tax=Shinella sp. H4-D48 TaxID=2925841 RepID=UPI001F535187|nr:hypothetical protein [Shinella sp. H4-D48]UNK38018.1 hypothetical protein MNR02_16455 [Shinella sp. H4-D48]